MKSLDYLISRGALIAFLCLMLSSKFLQGHEIFIKTFNNTENLTDIQISSCHLPVMYELHIMDVPMTWMEAMTTCYDMGYQTIMNAMSNWLTRLQIKRYLELNGYKDSNYTFWTGVFRPYIHVKKWFNNWGTGCRLYQTDNVPTGNLTNGLCSVIQKGSNTSSETNGIAECTQEHPFVCYRSEHGITYQAFEGFHVNNLTLDRAHLKSSEEINITHAIGANSTNMTDSNFTANLLDQCLAYCADDTGCNGITYDTMNISSPICIFIINSDLYYNITSQTNMTHYAKTECNITMDYSYDGPVSNRTFASFSDCGVDEIPQSYLQCVPGCPVKGLTPELIAALTVDKKTTLKYQSKFISDVDNRTSAKSIGVVGIIIIVLFASVFPVCDKVIPSKNVKSAKLKSPKKSTD